MLRTKLALKKLTKKEQKHLTEFNVKSMAGFLRTRKHQIGWIENGGREPCYECKHIARKLEVD